MDVDPAAAQVGLDDEGDAGDLDGHGLGVDLAAHAHAEGLGDEDGIGIARGEVGLGEAIERRLAGGLVHREVVALLEPGLEAELDLPGVGEPEGADLGLELLGHGAVPALDGARAPRSRRACCGGA